jgi:hypothetical protein
MKKVTPSRWFEFISIVVFIIATFVFLCGYNEHAMIALSGAIFSKLCEISYVIREK